MFLAMIAMAIYFVQCTATRLIKVGYSKNPSARISSLQVGSAPTLRLLATIPGDIGREAELHERFKHLRAKGEWYHPAIELYAAMDEREGVAMDLWTAISCAHPFQVSWITSDGTKAKSDVHPWLITVQHNSLSKRLQLSIDAWEGFVSSKDYTAFRNQGGISRARAKALDEIAKSYGFVNQMFTGSVLKDDWDGACCMLAWSKERKQDHVDVQVISSVYDIFSSV